MKNLQHKLQNKSARAIGRFFFGRKTMATQMQYTDIQLLFRVRVPEPVRLWLLKQQTTGGAIAFRQALTQVAQRASVYDSLAGAEFKYVTAMTMSNIAVETALKQLQAGPEKVDPECLNGDIASRQL
jgi:hypothetical protein